MRAFVVCLLIIAAGGRALADNRAEARKAFAAGQAADKREDWDAAIEHYMRANDLSPHPFAVYNIAVNHERRHRLREAATWYQRYLATTTDAAERERLQSKLSDLASAWSGLTVTSNPSGARVHVDGVPVGTTPYVGSIKGGFHRVSVELGGRRDQRDVTAEYGDPLELAFALRAPDRAGAAPDRAGAAPDRAGAAAGPAPPPVIAPDAAAGVLRIVGAPAGATIIIDGVVHRENTETIAAPAGIRTVRVQHAEFGEYEARVAVVAGRETPVTVVMPPQPAPARRLVGFMVGGGGGIDARGAGAVTMIEASVRGWRLDFGGRIVSIDDATLFDLFARAYLSPGWISPFAGGGYSFGESFSGYTLIAGVRADVWSASHITLSVIAESGLRSYRETSAMTTDDTKTAIPINAFLMISYR